MKQKSNSSIIGRALATVAGFDRVYRTLEQQVVLRGQAKSTFENYIQRIAQVSLHFNRLPEEVSSEELNEYLVSLAVSAQSPSRSAFKHSVYGLRYYYRYVGLPDRAVKLPSLKKDTKLPTFLTNQYFRQPGNRIFCTTWQLVDRGNMHFAFCGILHNTPEFSFPDYSDRTNFSSV